jgi:uncharacterized lipoprotein YddW (UPF0748 family)
MSIVSSVVSSIVSSKPVFGVWMWIDSVGAFGAPKVFDICASIGVTDVFLLTKGLSGKAAFLRSDKAMAFVDPQRDLLEEALDAAHQRGIRLHAWFTSASDALYKATYPKSGLYHLRNGRDRDIVSITDARYTDYMRGVIGDLCRNYDIDGLHLDYIRYNHLLYGWSDEDMARYASAGADVALLHGWVEQTFFNTETPELIFNKYREGEQNARLLASVRRKSVVRFAKAMIEAARAEKPELTLSAALMPEGAYDDLAFSDLHYGQNYDDARSLYDIVLPMSYSLSYNKDAAWVRQVACQTVAKGLKAISGIHAFEGATSETLAADIAAVKDAPIEGICLFRFGRHAYALAGNNKIRLINATDMPIKRVEINGIAQNLTAAPMDEALVDGYGEIRAYGDEGEIAVLCI